MGVMMAGEVVEEHLNSEETKEEVVALAGY